jgi:riboflavin kinase/FMN adenylyltransferase
MQKPSTILIKDNIDTIAIGSFDGIHLGHMQLINRLGKNGALFVIDRDHANLTPGIKRNEYSKYPCMYYHFAKVKDLSGEEFIRLLKKEFVNLKKIIIGYDFQFGKERCCDAEDLAKLSNCEVEVVEEFKCDGVSVHSSTIRDLLLAGKIDEANRFLGREYSITGDVVSGQGLGRSELYPTINIRVRNYLLPRNGVYASRSKIGSKVYDSVSFIGVRESTDGNFSIETHILDEEVDVGENIEIFFVKYLRGNEKFKSLALLKEQISLDIKTAKEVLKVCSLYKHG